MWRSGNFLEGANVGFRARQGVELTDFKRGTGFRGRLKSMRAV